MCFHVDGRGVGDGTESARVLVWPFAPVVDMSCADFPVLLPDLLRIKKARKLRFTGHVIGHWGRRDMSWPLVWPLGSVVDGVVWGHRRVVAKVHRMNKKPWLQGVMPLLVFFCVA